jgi:hypothetical protein
MNKMTIGIAVLCGILSTSSFAANKSNSDVPNPCYNGGLSFGLAGYNAPAEAMEPTPEHNLPAAGELTKGAVKS